MRVRDHALWADEEVTRALARVLRFMSGDAEYLFSFTPGHDTPPERLFVGEQFAVPLDQPVSVSLFSGGLDSLAGAVELLDRTAAPVCLVSHRSQPGVTRTQDQLIAALRKQYPDRIIQYPFTCTLHGKRALEESQRTRAFLYTSIAFALSAALSQDHLYLYENGFRALNPLLRQDAVNARASRTAHPQTVSLLEAFLSLVAERRFEIRTPFLWKTKADIMSQLSGSPASGLATSAVSCSRTRRKPRGTTHCGLCSQCVDRRIAVYAAGLDDRFDDVGTYAHDFITEGVADSEVRGRLVDYIRQATEYRTWDIDAFWQSEFDEIAEVNGHIPGLGEQKTVERLYDLCSRHAEQVFTALRRMRGVHDDLVSPYGPRSLLGLITSREYAREPVEQLADRLHAKLSQALPMLYQTEPPADEQRLNDALAALLDDGRGEWQREFPILKFGLARAIPDHSLPTYDLLVEAKYIRQGTTPSRASEGLAADLTKYPEHQYKLFVVFDPYDKVADAQAFGRPFEARGNCRVCVVRRVR